MSDAFLFSLNKVSIEHRVFAHTSGKKHSDAALYTSRSTVLF